MALQCMAFVKYAFIYNDFKKSLDESTPLKFRYNDGEITEATDIMTTLLFWTKWL